MMAGYGGVGLLERCPSDVRIVGILKREGVLLNGGVSRLSKGRWEVPFRFSGRRRCRRKGCITMLFCFEMNEQCK